MVPGVAGIFLFIDQWTSGSPDSPLLPVFCIALMVWCALFLDLWKRRNSAIVFSWGVDGVEDEELMRSVAARVCSSIFCFLSVPQCSNIGPCRVVHYIVSSRYKYWL